jgi:hypothetical protein
MQYHAIRLHGAEDEVASKTQDFDNAVSFDLTDIRWVGKELSKLARGRRGEDPLFTVALAQLRENFAAGQLAAGVQHLEADLGTLRHGGISHDVGALRRPALEVVKRARWSTDAQLKRYNKYIRMQMQIAKLAPEAQAFAARISQLLPRLVQDQLLVNALWRDAST